MSTRASPFPSIARLSIGTVLAFGSVVYAYYLIGGDLKFLAHRNVALIVAGGPVAMIAASRSLQRLANAALAAGVIGFIMGLIHVMTNLDKPDTIGVGIAVGLLAVLYALAAAHVLGSAAMGEQAKPAGARPPRIPDLLPYALMAVSFLLLLTFAVLYAIRQT